MIGVATSSTTRRKSASAGVGCYFPATEPIWVGVFRTWTTTSTFAETPVWTSQVIHAGDASGYSRSVTLHHVVSGKRCVVFDKGLVLELQILKDRDRVVVSDERFGIYGSGTTDQEALADYSEFFVDFFEEIVNTLDSELPESTKEFKRTLLTFGKMVNIG